MHMKLLKENVSELENAVIEQVENQETKFEEIIDSEQEKKQTKASSVSDNIDSDDVEQEKQLW